MSPALAGGFFTTSATWEVPFHREIDGETVETVSDFIFLGSKITVDGDCSHKLKDAYSLEEKLCPT